MAVLTTSKNKVNKEAEEKEKAINIAYSLLEKGSLKESALRNRLSFVYCCKDYAINYAIDQLHKDVIYVDTTPITEVVDYEFELNK